ncbi:MAG: hypothetical protein WBA74_20080 [Cyclobacteriaceae bacterium]
MQKIKIFFLIAGGFILSVICSSESSAQTTRSVEQILEQRSSKQASSKKKKKFSLFKKKKATAKTDAVLREEYAKRLKSNAKKSRKEARLARKPQYSDPSYFGHKKPPKKRPVGKKKFCKECHIVH